jgi:hypothetical protein
MAIQNPNWDQVKGMDIDDLGAWGAVDQNSDRANSARVGFLRLQTKAMQDAAAAQIDASSIQKAAAEAAIRAANATEETAKYTQASAKWMKWSVIVLAVASIANLLATLFQQH